MASTASRAQIPESRQTLQTDVPPSRGGSIPAPTCNREEWESYFVSCLATIDSIARGLARRHRLSADDADDLASTVRLRILADDYAVLRKFQGRSSLRTYLTVVIHRMLMDERTARLGKWRPSQQAQREGPTAMLFERLTLRDGLPFDEACDALEINHRVEINRAALVGLYARVRRCPIRRFVTTNQDLESVPAPLPSPDDTLAGAERAALGGRARIALGRAVASLRMQDRRILQLRFARGFSIADVARTMGLKQKALYSRCERLLKTLRSQLEAQGFIGREIMDTLCHADVDPDPRERSIVRRRACR